LSALKIEKHHFDSGKAGPHLVVLGAIHGNETCGPHALRKIVSEFQSSARELVRGKLSVFPVCNPRAFESNTRYIEENLNRVFEIHPSPTSYERQLAAQICPWVETADALLDLHSMQSQGDPFVFLNSPTPASQALCEALDTQWILRGWPDVYAARPELLSSCTQTFADRKGIPNALIECGRHGDPNGDKVGYRAVIGALRFYAMIEDPRPTPHKTPQHIKMTDLHIRKSAEDALARDWKNFEEFKTGELLALRAGGQEIRAASDGVMILPSPISALGTEWFYTGHKLNSVGL